jgi:hypothetical protein
MALALLIAMPGCGIFFGKGNSDQPNVSQQKAQAELAAARAAAKGAPGDASKASELAKKITHILHAERIPRSRLDVEGLLVEAGAALDGAETKTPEEKASLEETRGRMLLTAGKKEEGVAALRRSMDAKPSVRVCTDLIARLHSAGAGPDEIVPLCKQTLPHAKGVGRFELLASCFNHSGEKDVDVGLAWAGKAEIAYFEKTRAELRADARERSAAREAERAESGSGSSGSGSSAKSSSGGWSVNLKNGCSRTVKLFIGSKPKFGGGTTTSLGSNNLTSFNGGPEDKLWIIDAQENGVASVAPSGSQQLEITSGCSGFANR